MMINLSFRKKNKQKTNKTDKTNVQSGLQNEEKIQLIKTG